MAQAASMSQTEAPVSNYPIAMGADLGIVKAQLKEHMVRMHISSGIDLELVLHLCKDCLLDIRTIYLGGETVAFIDYVPSATMPNPVLAKAGTHTVGKARVIVDTALASDKVDPSFLEDYANLITKGRSKVIKKDYLINNSRWRNEADLTPPATVYSLGEEAALNRSGNQPSSSTPTSKKTFFDEVLRGVQGLNHDDLTSLISALMMEDKQRGTKKAAPTKPSVVGNNVPFKAGGGVADVSAIPQHSSPIGNIPSQQTVQSPVPPFNLNHPTESQPSGLPPPPTYNTCAGLNPLSSTIYGNHPGAIACPLCLDWHWVTPLQGMESHRPTQLEHSHVTCSHWLVMQGVTSYIYHQGTGPGVLWYLVVLVSTPSCTGSTGTLQVAAPVVRDLQQRECAPLHSIPCTALESAQPRQEVWSARWCVTPTYCVQRTSNKHISRTRVKLC